LGYYIFDVASTLQYLPPTVRPDLLTGYQSLRQLPENYVPITAGFFIMAIIEALSFHVHNPQEHTNVADTVKEIAQEHIPFYLQGESFLFNKY
jgi:hypothetical protein